jgi:peptide/nickel transport system permease protein
MAETIDRPWGAPVEPKRRSALADFFIRLVREKPLGTVGAIIVLLMLLTAIFAPFLAPHPYQEIHMADRLEPPGDRYLLGADALGRDLLSRIVYGARISLYVGLGASAINVVFAAIIGIPSGYIGGTLDLVVQRFVDALLSFPGLIFMITIMSLVGTGLVQVIVVLGILGGIGWIRVMRAAAMGIRENVYFEAARAIGASTPRLLGRHVLPNIMPVMIIAFSVSVAGNILAEASLSFLGVGIPPPAPSWGGMLSLEGRVYMYEAPWLAIWPGVALSVAVYGISMWGDAVRDLLDPRLRGGEGRYGRAKRKKAEKEKKTEAQEVNQSE